MKDCNKKKIVNKMASLDEPAIIQDSSNSEAPATSLDDNLHLACLEDNLLSLEKLDRASPELWPEQTWVYVCMSLNKFCTLMGEFKQESDSDVSKVDGDEEFDGFDNGAVPGVSEFLPAPAPVTSQDLPLPAWNKPLSTEDMNYMHKLGCQSISGLIMEVKRLHDLAYTLGVEESKEINRGRYLDIFGKADQT